MHERLEPHIARLFARELAHSACATLVVRSSSMKPFILPGSTLSVQRVPTQEYGCGDIIVFLRDDELYVHRLIRRMIQDGRTAFLTKGDNAFAFDEPVPCGQVLGRAMSVQNASGVVRFQTALGRIIGRFAAVLSYLAAFAYGQLRTLKRFMMKP
ncbi:MAG: signal peptidase I [Candidatus Omnitrophica bacterium]|nr:signal peptidase I [Candidatus Omnitrophota bacterium]